MINDKVDLLVFGETTLDTITQVERLPLPEGTASKIIKMHSASVGGRGTNVGTFASILGAKVALISACGRNYQEKYEKFEIDTKIDCKYLFVDEEEDATAKAIVFRDPTQAVTYFHSGLIGNTDKLENYKKHIRNSIIKVNTRLIYCTSELHNMVEEVFRHFKSKKGVLKVFAPGPEIENINSELLKRILNLSDIIFLNYKEMSHAQSILNLQLSEIINKFKIKSIIVTIGSMGAMLVRKDKGKIENLWFPSYPVKKDTIVDTTGAGDSLAGSFLGRLLTQKKPNYEECLKFGIVASSIVVQHYGCLVPKLKFKEIEDRFNNLQKSQK